ncbi:hypothetical protein ACS0TY_014664 [Phlomoides rotata]
MVKPMSMNEVLDASRGKMFASLVPDSSAKSLSRYTEMVDDIIRTQAEKLQKGSELARVRLKEMDLPDSILALEGTASLSTALKEDVEAVQICGGPAGLEGELQQLKDLSRVNHELLVQTEELLQKEATEDAQFRNQFGTQWTRPQSNTLTKNLLDKLNRFAANLKRATESDARIERSVREHSTLMSILDSRPDACCWWSFLTCDVKCMACSRASQNKLLPTSSINLKSTACLCFLWLFIDHLIK